MKTHYVYMVIDPYTNEFYYGSRTCECNAIDDVDYKGSMCRWQPDKSKLIKTIIRDDFETRTDATEYESNIISEHITNELNRNYHIPNKGFYSVGGYKKYHPFTSNKAMKYMCKLYNIKCHTKNGSDIDWSKYRDVFGFVENIPIKTYPVLIQRMDYKLMQPNERKIQQLPKKYNILIG